MLPSKEGIRPEGKPTLAIPTFEGIFRGGLMSSNNAFCTSGSSPHTKLEADLLFENHFSLFLIRPVSPLGKTWLEENVADDAQTLGEAVACEPRYVENIFRGATNDGLVCR